MNFFFPQNVFSAADRMQWNGEDEDDPSAPNALHLEPKKSNRFFRSFENFNNHFFFKLIILVDDGDFCFISLICQMMPRLVFRELL